MPAGVVLVTSDAYERFQREKDAAAPAGRPAGGAAAPKEKKEKAAPAEKAAKKARARSSGGGGAADGAAAAPPASGRPARRTKLAAGEKMAGWAAADLRSSPARG